MPTNTKPIGVAYSDQDINGAQYLLSSEYLGYTTDAQGSVTQATSKSTAVTLNKSAGTVTMNNAALGATTSVSFTLNNSFIILDESQNTTVEQMKMFLTRIGFGSTAVITGDITQVDLPRGTKSGLTHVIDVLRDVPGIAFTHFMPKDVVRHPLVQRIVEAYERHENRTHGKTNGPGESGNDHA